MSRRAPRMPGSGRPGRPWKKADTHPLVEMSGTVKIGGVSLPYVPPEERLDGYRRCVEQVGDAAALVEAVRHCQQTGETVPVWIVKALDVWLSEYVEGATPKKHRPRLNRHLFKPWGRAYMHTWRDFAIADHLEWNRRFEGLQWDEALDEASCYFRGTALAGSPEALKKANQRARQRARQGWFQRTTTRWESRVLAPYLNPEFLRGGPRDYWLIINEGREGEYPGEWRERPRLLAHLSTAKLHTEAQKVIARWPGGVRPLLHTRKKRRRPQTQERGRRRR